MKNTTPILLTLLAILLAGALYYFVTAKGKSKQDHAKNETEDQAPEVDSTPKPNTSGSSTPTKPAATPASNQVAEMFGLSADSVEICKDIAQKINSAIKPFYGNDDEDQIIKQLNRLNGPKGVACVNYFYKQYSKTKYNLGWDTISTLTEKEFSQVKTIVRPHLMTLAKEFGTPRFDKF